MKLDVPFYTNWSRWAVARVLKLAAQGSPMLPSFLAECDGVGRAALTAFSGFPEINGGFFRWAPRLYKWAKFNPDPLKDTRSRIARMMERWPDNPEPRPVPILPKESLILLPPPAPPALPPSTLIEPGTSV